jgi:putative ABC transport system ATP-binding protein
VTATGLAHRFPGTNVLFSNVSFALAPGTVLGLCGPSGSGKSTLLSILAKWEKPWHGAIAYSYVNRIGWVFQNPHGVAARSALDHVVYPLLTRGMRRPDAETKALKVMEDFRLIEVAQRSFSALSGGEAQRLMLARAVCQSPDLLLVDEPTAQLDTSTAATVTETLHLLAEHGLMVVIATHDAAARATCTHIVDLADHVSNQDAATSFAPH